MKKELIFMLGAAVLGTVCFSNTTADKVSANTSGDYKYVITGKQKKTCTIRKYTGKDKDVTVPEKLDGYTVTRIGNSAFAHNKKIQSIKLPNHITVIGEKSFAGCTNLKDIIFSPKLHTVKKNAFKSCKHLNSIKLPDSVKSIGKYAFYNCRKLESIYIPENLGETNLDSVFERDYLTNITVAEGNKYYDSRDNCNAVIETTSDKLIFGAKNSTVPDSVKIIGEDAFYLCHTIKEITIPASVKTIEDNAFYQCGSLEKVNFSEGLKTVGDGAFYGCDSLKDIKLPDSVETVEEFAFVCCYKNTSIYIPKNLGKTKLSSTFEFEGVTKITVAEGNKFYDSRDNCNAVIETASNTLVMGCDKTLIPDTVKVIGENAFIDRTSDLVIPEGVEKISEDVFGYNCMIEKIVLPVSLKEIGDSGYYVKTVNYRGSKDQWEKIKLSDPDWVKDVKINYNYKG